MLDPNWLTAGPSTQATRLRRAHGIGRESVGSASGAASPTVIWRGRRVRSLGLPALPPSRRRRSRCPAKRSVGRAPSFSGTHRRCWVDLPVLDKRRGFPGPTASGCVPPLQPHRRGMALSIVETHAITGGVDTHADVHVAAGALDPDRRAARRPGIPGQPGRRCPPPGVAGRVRDRLPGRDRRHRQLRRPARHVATAGVRVVEAGLLPTARAPLPGRASPTLSMPSALPGPPSPAGPAARPRDGTARPGRSVR